MIYFDYNATAPLHKNVIKKIQSLKFEEFGNPSSVHKIGRNSKKVVEEVRRNILSILKAKNYDLIFTSGATESNNLAIKGFIKKNNIKTIYSLETEHASVIDVVKSLEIAKQFLLLKVIVVFRLACVFLLMMPLFMVYRVIMRLKMVTLFLWIVE